MRSQQNAPQQMQMSVTLRIQVELVQLVAPKNQKIWCFEFGVIISEERQTPVIFVAPSRTAF